MKKAGNVPAFFMIYPWEELGNETENDGSNESKADANQRCVKRGTQAAFRRNHW